MRVAHELSVVDARDPLDHLREHPVRGRRVVLELRARLEGEPPLREPSPPPVARVPVGRTERHAREAARVREQLLDGDDVLPVRRELGNDSATRSDVRNRSSPISNQIALAMIAFVLEKMT